MFYRWARSLSRLKPAAEHCRAMTNCREVAEQLNRRGEDFFRRRDFAQAAKHFEEAITRCVDFVPPYNNLAVIRHQQDEYAQALDLLIQAIDLAPDYRPARMNLRKVLDALGHVDELLESLPQYLQTHPDDDRARRFLTAVRTALGLADAPIPKASSPKPARPAPPPCVELPAEAPSGQAVVLYALRELHLPILLPVYEQLVARDIKPVGFMAPPYFAGDAQRPAEGLRPQSIESLRQQGAAFWGHRNRGKFRCVITADVCYDRVDGWGPVVCVGHGTISKNLFFVDSPTARRENFATVLCVPGPWYVTSFGDHVHTRIEPTGFPKMDELAQADESFGPRLFSQIGFDQNKKTILFAPTFNPDLSALEALYPHWAGLDSSRYQVLVKLHGVTETAWLERYRQLCDQHRHLHLVDDPSIVPYMHVSDLLVSDLSSAYVEYLVLNKPFILFDNPLLTQSPFYNPQTVEFVVRDAGYGLDNPSSLAAEIETALQNDTLAAKRQEYAQLLFPPLDGKNSVRVADVIEQLIGAGARPAPAYVEPLNIYLPPYLKSQDTVDQNIAAMATQPRQCSRTVPATPFAILTGEHRLPHGWDQLAQLLGRFSPEASVIGPVLPDGPTGLYQQRRLLFDQQLAAPPSVLQLLHKYQHFGEAHPVESLRPDGMVLLSAVPEESLRQWLDKLDDVDNQFAFARALKKAGMNMVASGGVFAFVPTAADQRDEQSILKGGQAFSI